MSRSPDPSSRLLVLCGAIGPLWCAAWYCRGGSQAVLILTVVLAGLALLLPRPFPRSARWIIWSGVVAVVAYLAANGSRIAPPENVLYETHLQDRVVTLVFALGMAVLFFGAGPIRLTLLLVSGLPLLMVVLARPHPLPGAVEGVLSQVMVWGALVWFVIAEWILLLTASHASPQTAWGRREAAMRIGLLAGVLGLGFLVQFPVGGTARYLLHKVPEWINRFTPPDLSRPSDLSLRLPPPADFDRHTRVLMLIGSKEAPGYLRERVFSTYRGGHWLAPREGEPLPAPAGDLGNEMKRSYTVHPAPMARQAGGWEVQVMEPGRLCGFCLPGCAISLAYEGYPAQRGADGAITVLKSLPDHFTTEVERLPVESQAYPLPATNPGPAYLVIPEALLLPVSNWVDSCVGLAGETRTEPALLRVQQFFQTQFTYRLAVHLDDAVDPLVDFMRRREGSCTYFASAAALMLRARGIPTRVVGGYYCGEWNSWIRQWVVRERDGHAWLEAWDGTGKRWLLLDPTPDDGRPAALEQAGWARLTQDALEAGWRRLITWLTHADLLTVLAETAGGVLQAFWWLLRVTYGMPVWLLVAGVWWRIRRRRTRGGAGQDPRRAELALAMQTLAERLVPHAERRRPEESWEAWLRRIREGLAPSLQREVDELVEQYQQLRYRVRLDEPGARAWLERARRCSKDKRDA